MDKYIVKKSTWFIFSAIILLGALIRLWGTNWGLPALLHPDEGTIVDSAIRMAEHHSFEPDMFARPDHLEIQINMIIDVIISHLFFRLPIHEMAQYHNDILFMSARVITALFGVGMIVLSYLIGAKIKKEIGLIAAFLFALFPGFIEHSHYATPDIPTGFFMLLCIYFCIRYMQKPVMRNLVLICISISAFIAVKYPGLILCTFVAIAVIMRGIQDKNFKRIIKHGLMAMIMVPGFLFIISPVLFTNYQAVKASLLGESNPVRPGADGLGYWGNLLYYFDTYLSYSGIILFFFFLCGVYAFVKKKIDLKFVPIFFSIIYFAALSYIGLHWERWAVPMYVSPLLVSSVGVYFVYRYIKHKKDYIFKIIFYVGVAVALINLSSTSVAKLIKFLVPDTRVASQSYCQANNINVENTNFEGYSPLFPTSPKLLDSLLKSNGKYYETNPKIKYILLSDGVYSRYISDPKRFRDQNNLLNGITAQYKLIKEYSPAQLKSSPIDLLNTVYSMKYLYQVKQKHYSGPLLKFYKVSEKSYKNPNNNMPSSKS